jgi:hypothetical protein
LSGDGFTVVFTVRDAEGPGAGVFASRKGRTELISRATGAGGPPAAGVAGHPSVSSDGRQATFTSDAWNLSAGKCNAARGVFVRDLERATTTLVSTGDGSNRYVGAARGSSAAGDMTIALVCA